MPTRLLFLSIALLLVTPAHAQQPLKHEMRGVWMASVFNLDWPSSRNATPAAQQQDLLDQLDRLQALGLNAVFLQVRPEGDALYDSTIEPWSYYLTGQQGQPPSPYYDPLAFAIEAAHARGMELHAWFNPFRAAISSGSYARAATHVTRSHPDWILAIDQLRLLDPGLPDVRDYVTGVIVDVVRRYDVDGIHFDDYFYPYQGIVLEDEATFNAHSRGFTNIGAWRIDNINLFVQQVYGAIQAEKPWVKFGISPFGIWRSGTPPGISGTSGVDVTYADAVAWLEGGWLDYLAPQLYWAFGGGQDYGTLAPWWASVAHGRHIYPGLAAFKAEAATYTGTRFAPTEVPRQVRFNQAREGLQGGIFFRAANLTRYATQGLADTLATGLYPHPALPPVMDWKDFFPPGQPGNLVASTAPDGTVTLTWDPPFPDAFSPEARRFGVYRVASSATPDYAAVVQDVTHLIAITGNPTYTDQPPPLMEPYHYVVTAVSANAIESVESNAVVVQGQAVAVHAEPQYAFALYQNYPNPFIGSTEVRYVLDRPATVTLKVYDLMGREVVTLVEGRLQQPGDHVVPWNGTSARGRTLSSGTYFYTLEAGGRRVTKGMVLLR